MWLNIFILIPRYGQGGDSGMSACHKVGEGGPGSWAFHEPWPMPSQHGVRGVQLSQLVPPPATDGQLIKALQRQED